MGDTGAKGGEPHYWTLGEAQKFAAELTGAGATAPAALRRKLCTGAAAGCRKVTSNIVLALRPEKKGQADEQILEGVCAKQACGHRAKEVAAEVEPFQILDESPNPADAGAWQGTTTEPVTVRLYYWDPSLESKAVFEWAMKEEEHQPTTGEIFDTYRASRQEVIARLESIPLAAWCRTGQHEEFGTVTIRQQASYFASHEITHLPQIEALRASAT